MDYSNPLGIKYRVVNEREFQARPVRVVSGARVYNARIEELWDAVTNAERIPRWFAPISGDLELGGRYQLKGNAGGKSTQCEKPTAFDITWEYAGNISWVTVRLEPVTDGTRLTLEHLMSKDDESEAHWRKYGPGATGVGWDLGFLGLDFHLKSGGDAVDEEENNEWLTCPDGKAFLRGCAKAWGEAHTDPGEDPTIATTKADGTAAFYCGEEHQH